jgi:exodeoxyribonuclease VII large subunit
MQQRFDEAILKLQHVKQAVFRKRALFNHTSQLLHLAAQQSINLVLQPQKRKIGELSVHLPHQARKLLEMEKSQVSQLSARLNELSPYEALRRGYAVILKERKLVQSIRQVALHESLDIRLQDGLLSCEIQSVEPYPETRRK